MSVKAKVEAIIYATEEPVTLNQLASLLKDEVLVEARAKEAVRRALDETVSDRRAAHGDEGSKLSADIAESGPTQEPAADTESDSGSQAPSPGENKAKAKQEFTEVTARVREVVGQLISDYSAGDRGMEIREIAGGYRMATKPEHHDAVVGFARSLKPPIRLSLQALETLSVIAYKQPVTVPEISEIRGVDSTGVIATLLDRKLVTTAGRKQVIGRPILYKTTKEFLMRFGLKDLSELPGVEEFEKLGDPQTELFAGDSRGTHATSTSGSQAQAAQGGGTSAQAETAEPGRGSSQA